MVQPKEGQLGPITILDEDAGGTVNASGANIQTVGGVTHVSEALPGPGNDSFWVEAGTPSLPKFTDSTGTTITIGSGNGDVTGPGSGSDNNIVVFDGVTGKILKDSGFNLTTIDGANGEVLTTDGAGNITFTSAGTPSGPDRSIQFKDGIVFGGQAQLLYTDDSTNNYMDLTNVSATGTTGLRVFDNTATQSMAFTFNDNTSEALAATFAGANFTVSGSGNLNLSANSNIVIDSGSPLIWPSSDGANGDVLTTDGAGNLSFSTVAGVAQGLQLNYDVGNLIVTDAAGGPIDFSGDQEINLTAGYGTTGNSSFSIQANDPSPVVLSLATINTGGVGVLNLSGQDSAVLQTTQGDLTVNAINGFAQLSSSHNDPNNALVAIASSNTGAGRADISITAQDDIAITAIDGYVNISSSGISNSWNTSGNSPDNIVLALGGINSGAGSTEVNIGSDTVLLFALTGGELNFDGGSGSSDTWPSVQGPGFLQNDGLGALSWQPAVQPPNVLTVVSSTPTTIIDSSLAEQRIIPVDTSASGTNGPATINLPTTPFEGEIVTIKDWGNSSASNQITVGFNGNNINNAAADDTLSDNGGAISYIWDSTLNSWISF